MNKDKRTYMIKLQQDLIRSGQFPACTSCEHWNEHREVCEFGGWNQRPPATVIVTGCVNYSAGIPF